MKRSWFSRHPLCFMALYLILYLSAFNFLNTQIHMPHILVHCRLDDLIPFCKYAVIPYFAWFPWIPFTLFFLLWKAPREDFWRLCMPLFSGMTIALACYVILPTGLNLRPCYAGHRHLSPVRCGSCTAPTPHQCLPVHPCVQLGHADACSSPLPSLSSPGSAGCARPLMCCASPLYAPPCCSSSTVASMQRWRLLALALDTAFSRMMDTNDLPQMRRI